MNGKTNKKSTSKSNKKSNKVITVMVPCYNEEQTIGSVIDNIPKAKLNALGYKVDVLVVDNNSKDNTSKVAKSKGARVLRENRQGKGHAIFKGFRNLLPETKIVVMMDGDNTYDASEMLRLVEPLENDFSDVIIGSRLTGKIEDGALTKFNRAGNWMFTFLARTCYHENVTDVCTGYFAWKRYVVDELLKHIESNGFSIEMEIIAKMAKLGYSIYSVPITYSKDEGQTSLHPLKDGARIMNAWARYLFWDPQEAYHSQKDKPTTHYGKMIAGLY